MSSSRKMAIALMASVATLAVAPQASASGLIAKRYVSAMVGQVETGDEHLEQYDDAFTAYEAKLNVPVTEHVDLGFRYGREVLEGSHGGHDLEESEDLYLGETTYHFRPHDHHYNPFLRVRAGLIQTTVEEGGTTHTEDEAAYSFAAGADLGMGEHAAVAPEVAYRMVDGEGEWIPSLEANYWLGESAFLMAKGEYRDETEDVGYFIGGGWHF